MLNKNVRGGDKKVAERDFVVVVIWRKGDEKVLFQNRKNLREKNLDFVA